VDVEINCWLTNRASFRANSSRTPVLGLRTKFPGWTGRLCFDVLEKDVLEKDVSIDNYTLDISAAY
jgi:hypothetical protein